MSGPTTIRVTSYNVGFGDCFVLSFQYPDATADRHVLIDFGTTKLPLLGERSLEGVARQIADDTNGKLHMVAVTHRHADHMSGFAGKPGRIIADLQPDLVVQPWTEDPDLDPDATAPGSGGGGGGGGHTAAARAVTTRLAEMDTVAKSVRRAASRTLAAGRTPVSLGEELHFLGETNIKNGPAVRALMTMGKRRVYAKFGTRLPISTILPGVTVQVLGPPTAEQAPGMASMASKDAQEYWHLAAAVARRSADADPKPLFPDAEAVGIPQAARWLVPQIDRMNAEESLAIVRAIDDALNNTSLILLFDVRGTKLLFSGDAQIEDWRYALFGAATSPEIRASLADVAMYKVGHHGSLNGTPKTVWFGFTRRGDDLKPDRLRTMVSSLSGKHGKASRNTEVPRRKLMEALDAGSELHTTHLLRKTGAVRSLTIQVPD